MLEKNLKKCKFAGKNILKIQNLTNILFICLACEFKDFKVGVQKSVTSNQKRFNFFYNFAL